MRIDPKFLVIDDSQNLTNLKSIKTDLKVKLQLAANDQKVDLTICSSKDLLENPFLKSLSNKILLPL